MTSRKAIALTLLFLLSCAMLPAFLVNGQEHRLVQENMITLAAQTGSRIQNLITVVTSDEQAIAKIENASLSQQFEDNITLYHKDGLDKITAAKEALANANYDSAGDLTLQALATFKEVYTSLNQILESAGLSEYLPANSQGLMDAINRELERTNALESIVSHNATKQISDLQTANNNLLKAKTALSNGDYEQAQTLYLQAKQGIAQIYQYLKLQAQDSNFWRLGGYCEKLLQQVQERFRYGSQNGLDFTATLQGLGYQSENQLMQALQNKIANAKSQSDIKAAIQECLSLSEMVQNMEQSLDQEIDRQGGSNPFDGSSGAGGSDNGNGGSAGNSSTINSGYGLSDTAYKRMP